MNAAHQNDLIAALTALLAFCAERSRGGMLRLGLVDHATDRLLDVVAAQHGIDKEAARDVFTHQVNATLLPLLRKVDLVAEQPASAANPGGTLQ